jgi:hypothetical protein
MPPDAPVINMRGISSLFFIVALKRVWRGGGSAASAHGQYTHHRHNPHMRVTTSANADLLAVADCQ